MKMTTLYEKSIFFITISKEEIDRCNAYDEIEIKSEDYRFSRRGKEGGRDGALVVVWCCIRGDL